LPRHQKVDGIHLAKIAFTWTLSPMPSIVPPSTQSFRILLVELNRFAVVV